MYLISSKGIRTRGWLLLQNGSEIALNIHICAYICDWCASIKRIQVRL